MLNQQQIYTKWWEIKGGLRNLWAGLSEEELDAHKGDLDAITGLVYRKTGENREDIKEKMDHLMQSFDNETDKYDVYQSSFERSPLGADKGATSDMAPGMEGAATHRNYHVRHDGVPETGQTGGSDYNPTRIGNKNVQDFDSDRNTRH